MPLLKEVGLAPQRIAELWSSNDLFRSVEAQRLMYFAAKGYASEQAARNARPRPNPRPQSSNAVNGVESDLLSRIADRGDMEGYVRARNKGISR
jgi:hypothetical protein